MKLIFKKKSNKLIESAIWITLLMAFSTVFAALNGFPVFNKSNSSKASLFSLSADHLITKELREPFIVADKALSQDDQALIDFISQHKLNEVGNGVAYGGSARNLLFKIETIQKNLKPHVVEIEKELVEIDSLFVEKTIVVDVTEHNEHYGQHVIPLAEGLLGEYGPTGYHNGVFVSEEKDEFGHYPLTLGVSATEVSKIAKEFEKLRTAKQYPVGVELAHASFLHNFYRYCKKFDSSPACLHPDIAKVQETDDWYSSVRHEVASLKAKRKALIRLQSISLRFDMAKEKLAQRLAELAQL